MRQATAVQRAECRTQISPLPKERANTMNGLRGMAWLLVFQSIGEVLSRGLSLPLPGPVVGLVLLLAGLHFSAVREPEVA